MRGKLTRTLMLVVCLMAVVAVAGTRLGLTAGTAVLAVMIAGIALIQVGARDPYDGS